MYFYLFAGLRTLPVLVSFLEIMWTCLFSQGFRGHKKNKLCTARKGLCTTYEKYDSTLFLSVVFLTNTKAADGNPSSQILPIEGLLGGGGGRNIWSTAVSPPLSSF